MCWKSPKTLFLFFLILYSFPMMADGDLKTRFSKNVDPESVIPEYPRPLLARKRWINLNGLWDYSILPADSSYKNLPDGQILVPFPIESQLSGVKKKVGHENRLWYSRYFSMPEDYTGERIILNFGAVDWHARIWINDRYIGEHKGGYDPFSFDITDALTWSGKEKIVISVWDPTNKKAIPSGKQVINPGGIWYTSVTGIWQTVWLEPVPQSHIASIKITPDVDKGTITVTTHIEKGSPSQNLRITAFDGDIPVAEKVFSTDGEAKLSIPSPRLWSPGSPFIYNLAVALENGEMTIDRIESYFAMRKIEIAKDKSGLN
ncbi:MAG: hypothetical protein HQK54_17345, partial [Oligoflexales bacterium]|nr:hypothetical protein [Oligoflexales bacterium]